MADPAGDFRALGGSPPKQAMMRKTGSRNEGSYQASGNREEGMDNTEGPITEEYNQARVTEMLSRSSTRNGISNPIAAPKLLREMTRSDGTSSFTFKTQNGVVDGETSPRAQKLLDLKAAMEVTMKAGLAELEQRYERILEGMAECLTEELMGVQENMNLLQEQVDTHKNMLQKAIPDIQQKINEEKTSRSFVQRSLRESKTQLAEHISHQNRAMTDMRTRLEILEDRSRSCCAPCLMDYVFCCFRRRVYVNPNEWEMD